MVDENNLAVLEHMDNIFWQFFCNSILKDQKTFLQLHYESLQGREILNAHNLDGVSAVIGITMSRLGTEAVRRGIIPAQNTDGFDDLKRIIQENS